MYLVIEGKPFEIRPNGTVTWSSAEGWRSLPSLATAGHFRRQGIEYRITKAGWEASKRIRMDEAMGIAKRQG